MTKLYVCIHIIGKIIEGKIYIFIIVNILESQICTVLIILLAKIGNLMIIFLTMKMGVKIILSVTNAMDGKSKNTILEIIKPNNVQI